ncbi:anaphase promoting complex subunit 4 [Tieghemostelium lacteum]|uniref:Anaphase-promoting complex subunit 4 n=1 Tax=Tieghemostelium lacteum TaxID=361077 RepID=A0A151ZF77_TIELA|nr:anaphase promoting complex subunit 4 [Tieghemostelium lacteum]|eukprot:KYQ92520.1 anaphase promoting complex subunit 4 [Tieghemostelium lacteum]
MSNDYVLLKDKVIGNEAIHYKICPTMDLVAIASKDNHISIIRFMNWQRLFTILPNTSNASSITSLEWSPFGKMIAVVYENSSISLFSIENSKLLYSISPPSPSPISLSNRLPIDSKYKLIWLNSQLSNKGSSTNSLMYNENNYFPSINSYNKNSGDVTSNNNNSSGSNNVLYSSRELYEEFDILTCNDSNGNIRFMSHGILEIASLNIYQLLLDNKRIKELNRIKIIETSFCLKYLCVLIENEDTGVIMYVLVDIQVILNRRQEIHEITLEYIKINRLLEVMKSNLDDIFEKWGESMSSLQSKWVEFEKLLGDYGYSSSIEQELLDLLMSGCPTPPTNQFICNNVQIKKLKTIEQQCLTIRDQLISFLIPSFENIFHSLTNLHNMSLWKERYHGLLDTDFISSLLPIVGVFGIRLQFLIKLFGNLHQQYQSFFSWLYRIQCYSNQIQMEKKLYQPFNEILIMNLLQQGLKLDPIEFNMKQYQPISTDYFKYNNNENQQQGNIFEMFKEFQIKFQELFKPISKMIPSQFKINSIVPIYDYPISGGQPNSTSTTTTQSNSSDIKSSILVTEDYGIYVIVYVKSENKVILVHRNDKSSSQLKYNCYQLETNQFIEDMTFYDQDSFLCLISQIDTERKKKKSTSIVQFQVSFKELEIPLFSINSTLLDLLKEVDQNINQSDSDTIIKQREINSQYRAQNSVAFSVSNKRGISSVVFAQKRMQLYDLEDQEESNENENMDESQ